MAVAMQVHPDLLSYLEKRLPASQRCEVEAHLAACADCRLALDEMAALAGELAAIPSALRRLPGRSRRGWPAVWESVQRGRPRAIRRPPAWPMTLSVSLMTLCLVWPSVWPMRAASLAAGLPAGGVAHAPRVAARLPLTPQPFEPAGSQLLSTTAPLPVATPLPGPTR